MSELQDQIAMDIMGTQETMKANASYSDLRSLQQANLAIQPQYSSISRIVNSSPAVLPSIHLMSAPAIASSLFYDHESEHDQQVPTSPYTNNTLNSSEFSSDKYDASHLAARQGMVTATPVSANADNTIPCSVFERRIMETRQMLMDGRYQDDSERLSLLNSLHRLEMAKMRRMQRVKV
eukprot:CAMPEP_0184692042 /NCGR_PEP_ID=MMETSP0313-20130426/680_1 /TAXON_ID=2792 /ORGANISM="Porphyridium aerugineum, Strain SAG 1380-2" /LENGTH=178 /DNA_ID=CAMNT_0027149839 /DNA_START=78 /DNA_END=614 /DNA_ORIENTATION=-